MRRKNPIETKIGLALAAEEEMFLETSAADLVIRWPKEIRALSRKLRHDRAEHAGALTEKH